MYKQITANPWVVSIKRKVIQIGDSTQLISIPRSWAKRFNLQKGDELEVEERGSMLTVSTDKIATQTEIIIDAKKLGKFHKNYLSAAYQLGYDNVRISFEDEVTLQEIQERIKNCIGFEMVNQSRDFCEIKAISHALFSEFDSIVKKVFILLVTMGQNSHEIISTGEHKRLKEIMALEDTTNRLTDFCKRVLIKSGYQSKQERTAMMFNLVSDLERIGDYYQALCELLIQNEIKVTKEMITLYNDVNNLVDEFYKNFYKIKKIPLDELYGKNKKIKEAIVQALLDKKRQQEANFLYFVAQINHTIYEMTNTYVKLEL